MANFEFDFRHCDRLYLDIRVVAIDKQEKRGSYGQLIRAFPRHWDCASRPTGYPLWRLATIVAVATAESKSCHGIGTTSNQTYVQPYKYFSFNVHWGLVTIIAVVYTKSSGKKLHYIYLLCY